MFIHKLLKISCVNGFKLKYIFVHWDKKNHQSLKMFSLNKHI